jgi:hypothetical protein
MQGIEQHVNETHGVSVENEQRDFLHGKTPLEPNA